jgi:hypothetical protein
MLVQVVIFRNGKEIHKIIHWFTFFGKSENCWTLVPIAEQERWWKQSL